jgi:hypothetical protein
MFALKIHTEGNCYHLLEIRSGRWRARREARPWVLGALADWSGATRDGQSLHCCLAAPDFLLYVLEPDHNLHSPSCPAHPRLGWPTARTLLSQARSRGTVPTWQGPWPRSPSRSRGVTSARGERTWFLGPTWLACAGKESAPHTPSPLPMGTLPEWCGRRPWRWGPPPTCSKAPAVAARRRGPSPRRWRWPKSSPPRPGWSRAGAGWAGPQPLGPELRRSRRATHAATAVARAAAVAVAGLAAVPLPSRRAGSSSRRETGWHRRTGCASLRARLAQPAAGRTSASPGVGGARAAPLAPRAQPPGWEQQLGPGTWRAGVLGGSGTDSAQPRVSRRYCRLAAPDKLQGSRVGTAGGVPKLPLKRSKLETP